MSLASAPPALYPAKEKEMANTCQTIFRPATEKFATHRSENRETKGLRSKIGARGVRGNR